MATEFHCPRDGAILHVPDCVIWDAASAPLMCDVCQHSFWLAELDPGALKTYDAKNRTHRVPARLAAKEEARLAQIRGHGISSAVKALLSERQLELATSRGVVYDVT